MSGVQLHNSCWGIERCVLQENVKAINFNKIQYGGTANSCNRTEDKMIYLSVCLVLKKKQQKKNL